uniref:ABC3 transporter permease C-terminal domain-containing protein n=1 Tax=Chromera velia CCMP2878 TaxID=1169474 RepID=A0A0G4G8H5_9ALVE|eukprot:Cvel_4351.t1-p1 / transcript=Cvel_4351.t1 / gene=Cvel_4351 / organism=Chromera_velia_CCMP2878 / gene_product=hypothetical protein / transcript_product=hypothetical protein / location=Cvel_scaffold188:108009-115213(-) / protein_length=918 / sequence_SO=supercontig / SO=protein_coding / is_pseudo=false
MKIPCGTRNRFYYLHHTTTEIKRDKCAYCLGLSTCTLVIAVAALIDTVVQNSPAIFIRRVEGETGQVDVVIRSRQNWAVEDTDRLLIRAPPFLDYEKVDTLLRRGGEGTWSPSEIESQYFNFKDSDVFSYSSPRIVVSGVNAFSDCASLDLTWLHNNSLAISDGCGSAQSVEILAIDSSREARMGLGRDWDLGTIPKETAVLSKKMMNSLGVSKGDPIVLTFYLPNLLASIASEASASSSEIDDSVLLSEVRMVVLVGDEMPEEGGGKVGENESRNRVFMEISSFLQAVANGLSPILTSTYPNVKDRLLTVIPEKYSTEVLLNFPPERLSAYMDTVYDTILKRTTQFAARAQSRISPTGIALSLPITDGMRPFAQAATFVGLILNVILFVMFLLSIVLIYSLLIISVEASTYKLGILRMLGFNRQNLVELIIVQAAAFVVPALLLGFVIAAGVAVAISGFFASTTGVPVSNQLAPSSVAVGLVLGLLIPFASSILPILTAFRLNIRDALDTTRGKTNVVAFQIERTTPTFSKTQISVGLLLAVLGFGVYYLVPFALISMNLSLILWVFMVVLMGLIVGLVMLSLNLSQLAERAVVFCTLWWERPVVRRLVLMSLSAHRMRNRKTAIMYNLSLAVVIFLFTFLSIETQISLSRSLRNMGGRIGVSSINGGPPGFGLLSRELRAMKTEGFVKEWTWISEAMGGSSGAKVSNIGQLKTLTVALRALPPKFFDATLADEFLRVEKKAWASGFDSSLMDHLYGVRGSQESLMSASYSPELQVFGGEGAEERENGGSFLALVDALNGNRTCGSRLRPAAFLGSAPMMDFSSGTAESGDTLPVSVPSWLRISGACRYGTVFDFRESERSAEESNQVIYLIFAGATLVAMVLCFFSLMSSMTANIMEQTKEMTVLRCIGFRKWVKE